MSVDSSSTILERFRRGHGKDINLTLRQPYRDLLAKLGNPHLKLPPVVHVAGTNGKGSTCAFLRAAVEASGRKAHVYTSPHLVTFHERIRVAGRLIDEDLLCDILLNCEKLAEPGSLTFFEAATASAFMAFASKPADVCILEVGLGGRLDATNVVPYPAATVITRLSYDHRDYLGNTMASIAREKAGIMKAGSPCFSAYQPSNEATVVLQQCAADLHVPLFFGQRDWNVENVNYNIFRFTNSKGSLALPAPALVGKHQLENAGLALATLDALPFPIDDDAKRQAMLCVNWPGRLQRLSKGALVSSLPADCELWLDGGHNDSAGEVLAAQIKSWGEMDDRPLIVILGMLSTKSPQEFLAPFANDISLLCAVSIEGEPLSRTAEDIAEQACGLGVQHVLSAGNVSEALQLALRSAQTPYRILICGSLYLAGQVLRSNQVE